MAIQLGSAYGKIALDVGGFLKNVTKSKEGMLTLFEAGQNLGEGMKNVGRNLTIGLTLPIVALGAASVKAASDFEETKNKAVVVFGDMSESVVSNANKAATALGISKTQYLDYASSIGAALTAGGLGIKESTDLAEQAVKHFADLASFHNARVEDVAAAWQSAIRGQYEPIQKFFPFITDSYLKTYGVANGLVDENTSKLTANQRAIILNAIALDSKLNPALNDFSETSGGLANSSRILKAQLQDALVLLGQNLLPLVLILVSALNKLLTAFNNMPPGVQKLVVVLLALLALAGPLLSFIGTIVSLASSIGGVVTTLSGLGVTLPAVGAALGGLIPIAASLAAALLPILAILAGLALWIGIVYLAWRFNFLGMRDNITAFVAIVKNLWKALMAFLRGDTDAALEYLHEAFSIFQERLQEIFSNFLGLRDAWFRFVNFLQDALGKVVSYISNLFSKTDWSQLGKFITFGIANGMLLGIPALILAAANAAEATLEQIKRSLGIASDSKEAMKLGVFTGRGYLTGLSNTLDPNAIANMFAKPITNNSQQTIIQNFASGLTTQQVKGMIAENNEQLVNSIIGALGGA